MVVFGIFIWFTMKFVWPPLMKAMETRREKIADGLAAAEQGRNELELAKIKSQEMLTEAKSQAAGLLEQANHRANQIVEDAKTKARSEGERLLEIARGEIEQEYNNAREQLLAEVSHIAVAGAEKILTRSVTQGGDDGLIQQMMSDL